ncbi:MAG: metalloregulator ArsR/SmtB family transcription factor [Bacteroidia bacterium]|nr:metalloregulator ArsR/SmtB family transcription factor [Bacteroidia bacterium]
MEVITLWKEPEKLKRVAKLLKIIGHPSRLMIVELLLEKESLPVKDIFETIKISQSNASQHLKALEDVGILNSVRDGKNICYSIRIKDIAKLLNCVGTCADF